ncbi:MAG: RNA polymerase sigma factor [Xanthomonadaceae bacterium]|jgi:RNA polymerase sigma-70 factor (ECF subfamily)|nr:RNA polymerase sigma factor [Xanthomonadaceae bacterium]
MLVNTDLDLGNETQTATLWPSLDAFLAEIGIRAFRFAEAGLRHHDDALDAVQEAMMKMLAYRERPKQEWPPLFWSILRRKVIDLQRRRRFRLRWLLPADDHGDANAQVDWMDENSPGPSQTHEQREAYARMVAGLRNLPARQREAFTLRVLEDLDVATTAQVMGCSQGSVKTHLSRARDALQKYLEDFR